jgi:muramoyltetrapeptide carboxypeptidase
MDRRHFLNKAGIGLAMSGISLKETILLNSTESNLMKTKLVKPNRLNQKAVIALIAPASPPSDDKMAKAKASLTALGFTIKAGANLHARNGFLAGTDAERVADLHAAFLDPEVDAVWCVRGGYGTARLLPLIDFNLIKKHPKPFIGYSDITALHLAFQKKAGLITFHGPVGTSDFSEFTLQHLQRVLINPIPRFEIKAPNTVEAAALGSEYVPIVINSGFAKGNLMGGNLSLLASLVGTEYAPSYKNKLVFIEEVGEQPYRIDRMLTQLLQGSDFSKAAGFALGVFSDCKTEGKEASQSLFEVLKDRLGNLGVPVIYGLPFGHISNQATIPCGSMAELDTERQALVLTEWAVK